MIFIAKKIHTRTHFEIVAQVNSKNGLLRQEKMPDSPVRRSRDVVACKFEYSKRKGLEDQISKLSVCKKKPLLNEDLTTMIISN